MDNYIITVVYVSTNAESGVTDHSLEILGRTNDIDEMRELAQSYFEKAVKEDYDLLKEYQRHYEESPEEHREHCSIIISDKEDIVRMMDRMVSDGVIKPIIIGSLNNFNTEYNYNDQAFVAAIKEREGRS